MTGEQINRALAGIMRYSSRDVRIFGSPDVLEQLQRDDLLAKRDGVEIRKSEVDWEILGVYGYVLPFTVVKEWPPETLVGWCESLKRPLLPTEARP